MEVNLFATIALDALTELYSVLTATVFPAITGCAALEPMKEDELALFRPKAPFSKLPAAFILIYLADSGA